MKRNFRRNEKERSGANGNALKNSVNQQSARKTELFNFRLNGRKSQCKKCSAEAAELTSDGLCFDCEQKAEFVWREILTPDERAKILGSISPRAAAV